MMRTLLTGIYDCILVHLFDCWIWLFCAYNDNKTCNLAQVMAAWLLDTWRGWGFFHGMPQLLLIRGMTVEYENVIRAFPPLPTGSMSTGQRNLNLHRIDHRHEHVTIVLISPGSSGTVRSSSSLVLSFSLNEAYSAHSQVWKCLGHDKHHHNRLETKPSECGGVVRYQLLGSLKPFLMNKRPPVR